MAALVLLVIAIIIAIYLRHRAVYRKNIRLKRKAILLVYACSFGLNASVQHEESSILVIGACMKLQTQLFMISA